MSKYSGKCDFFDLIEIYGLDYILNSEIFVGDNKEPLSLKCVEDCIPYYPYVMTSGCMGGNKGTIYLTSRSWVDIEEEECGHSRMHDFYRELLEREIRENARR